jgi:Zn-dependent membrane protease YugP
MLSSLLLLVLIYGLQIGPAVMFSWATRRYGAHRPDLKYTGRELARLLLDKQGLTDVAVEELPGNTSDFGDCYDPENRKVQLSSNVADQRSIAAYAVAAHEVGHALQHAAHDNTMELQHGLVWFARIMTYAFIGSVLFLALFSESLGGRDRWHWVSSVALVLFVGSGVILRVVTLPVEWNASFSYALPMLRAGRFLDADDLDAARNLLFVAATTYIGFAVLGVLAATLLIAGD